MVLVYRRVTYKLYPTAAQECGLWRWHKLHCDLYNAARQEWIDAYRLAGKTIGFAAQCRSLTEIPLTIENTGRSMPIRREPPSSASTGPSRHSSDA